MVNTNTINISKGSLSVDLYVAETNANQDNKLFIITPPTAPASQGTGPKEPKVIDLLRITYTYRVRGYIADTTLANAYTQINTLRDIAKGASTDGGSCVAVVEPDNADTDYSTINCFIEKLTITRRAYDLDQNKTYSSDTIWFEVDLTLVKGLAIGEQ